MADEYSLFLPVWVASPPDPRRPRDPESTAQRQLARRLGAYGAILLRDHVKVEYTNQREGWSAHIGDVVTAFSMALGQHYATLTLAKDERRAAAELEMLMFSLVLGGVMGWAGTFVQYKLYPKLWGRPKTRLIRIEDAYGTIGVMRAARITVSDYNEQMAEFVGGLVTHVGSTTANYVSQQLANEQLPSGIADSDHVTLVRITEEWLQQALKDGTKVILDYIDRAVFWMQQSPQFGEAWADVSGKDESSARRKILAHLQAVRDSWANSWPYFGTKPMPISRYAVSDMIERAIWAAYLDGCFERFSKENQFSKFTYDELISRALDKRLSVKFGPGGGSPEPDPTAVSIMLRKADVGRAIVKRLIELNVVLAETFGEATQQAIRITKAETQAPAPTVRVEDKVDTLNEMRALWSWAREFPATVHVATAKAATSGVPRPPKPIPSY